MIKVLALDPGVTTGYAMGYVEPVDLTIDYGMTVATGQFMWDHKQLWLTLGNKDPDVVITESFEYRQKSRKGLRLDGVEYIGIITLWCALNNKKFIKQTAAQGKGHFDDRKLKDLHIYKPGKDHANDAARHLCHWYWFGHGYQYNNGNGKIIAGA